MSVGQIARDLAGRASAGLDLAGSRLRQSNHVFRRGKNKNVSTIVICVLGLLTLIAVIHGFRGSDDSMDLLMYDENSPEDEESGYAVDEGDYQKETLSSAESSNFRTSSAIPTDTSKAYSELMKAIKKYSPAGELDRTKSNECELGDIGITDSSKFSKLTEQSLRNCLQIPDETVKMLRVAQEDFRKVMIDDLLPRFHNLDPPAFRGEGIVISAGGKFSLFALPAIKAIRENSGVKLKHAIPIEIIIPPEDKADRGFCENVLPKIDPSGLTRCVFLDEIIDNETLSHMNGYQIKALALLVSSFEKVLMLDADNYVVNSIDDYFKHSTFKDKGLILWPDYWRRLHHPKLYEAMNLEIDRKDIARNSVDDTSPNYMYKQDAKDTPFHDLGNAIPDGGTESGQLMVDKKKHLDTLMLSLYFNYNGDSYYYPMLGQGFAGEGDKDTFVLATRVLHGKDSWYQVKTPVDALGHWADSKDEIRLTPEELEKATDDKSFRGTAMLQHDYIDDSRFLSLAHEVIGNTVRDKSQQFCDDWYKTHKDQFSDNNDERRKQCEESVEVQNAFHALMRSSYKFEDYLTFFKFTKVSFVHSHLPKYDPWEWYQSGDMMYDGAKALKNHKDDPEYKSVNSGHYRMYDNKLNQVTSYDLELANWSTFHTYLCDMKDGYKNFGYLSDKIAASKSSSQSYNDMCNYIEAKVKYLKSTTWEDFGI
ncbi:LANO_0A04676g1_1 [Lachancea nothofagi CBS 11611]|uniref:LANO_0A04676g1_1 n=1 Tax=Lachancea nothofagi CBS 11611 TaxID=1266666 RepID=A0A1G4IQJ9_9SACH|nr:LANO_0A04676g1_1 [Lachancea nothofagi CBS 11611]